MDEWGQVDLINLLVRYARVMLPRPIPSSTEASSSSAFEVDRDLKLLITSSEPLFQSNNPAVSVRRNVSDQWVVRMTMYPQVVLAVARVFYYLGSQTELPKIVPPLLRLLHTSPEVGRIVLTNLVIVSSSLSVGIIGEMQACD